MGKGPVNITVTLFIEGFFFSLFSYFNISFLLKFNIHTEKYIHH